ncbi:MAG TPA: PQQ-binding-like beta-propeller repeat protein [Candidatus Thermoplasmatota archaeon]|nr:PQQ-binding-like beta-propeller repeat protein [Candidatus Thermoplasmatota archaeon]
MAPRAPLALALLAMTVLAGCIAPPTASPANSGTAGAAETGEAAGSAGTAAPVVNAGSAGGAAPASNTAAASSTSQLLPLGLADLTLVSVSGVEATFHWRAQGPGVRTWLRLEGNQTGALGEAQQDATGWHATAYTEQNTTYTPVAHAIADTWEKVTLAGTPFNTGFEPLGISDIQARGEANLLNPPGAIMMLSAGWRVHGPPATTSWITYSYDLSYSNRLASRERAPGPGLDGLSWFSPSYDVQPDQTWHFQVHASDGAGHQVDAPPVAVAIPPDPKSRVTNLRAVNVTARTADVRWDWDGAPDGSGLGLVEVSTDPWFSNGHRPVPLTPLQPDTTYNMRVRRLHDCVANPPGQGSTCREVISNHVTFRTAASDPAPPAGPVAQQGPPGSRVRWMLANRDFFTPRFAAGGGSILLATLDSLRQVSAANGATAWSSAHPSNPMGIAAGVAIVEDNQAWTGQRYSQTLRGLDPATGAERWSRTAPNDVIAVDAVGDVRTLVWEPKGNLTALDTATGRVLWSVPNGCQGVTATTARVRVTTCQGGVGTDGAMRYRLVATDVATGQPAWSRDLAGGSPGKYCCVAPWLVVPASLVGYWIVAGPCGGERDVLALLDDATGATAWEGTAFDNRAPCPAGTAPVAGDHVIQNGYRNVAARTTGSSVVVPGKAAIAGNRTLVALDPASGRVAWTRTLEQAPANLVAGANAVYVLLADGTLSALDAATGNPRWSEAGLGGEPQMNLDPASGLLLVSTDRGLLALSP